MLYIYGTWCIPREWGVQPKGKGDVATGLSAKDAHLAQIECLLRSNAIRKLNQLDSYTRYGSSASEGTVSS